MIVIQPGEDTRAKPIAAVRGEGTLVSIRSVHGAFVKVLELDTLGEGNFEESARERTLEKDKLAPLNGEAARFLQLEIAGDWRENMVVDVSGTKRKPG